MADTSKQMQDIEALLAERRKYEQWIAQLEARKASTPPHVFRKVRADYDVRLGEAQALLAAETGAVQALITDLEATRATQDEKIGAKADERSEAELRASVGEFGEKEWDKLRGKLDGAITAMTAERDATQQELDRLRALLAEAEVSEEKEQAPAPRRTPEAQVTVAPVAVAATPTPEPAASRALEAPPVPASVAAPTAPAVPRPDFDELEFLKSVVGRTTPPTSPSGHSTIADPGSRSSSGAVARGSSAIRPSTPDLMATPDTPLEPSDDVKRESGAFQSSNLSALGGRTPRSSEAIKSLKCGECGSLNYPTEWYCERCGGELAAF